jgi:serine/threonine protein kinase
MEYCKNKDLGKLIRKIGSFNFKLAQYYAAEIISAISYMKKMGVYHRDLKPENIGIDEDMHLKILDFATSNIEGKYFDKKLMKFVEIDKTEYDKALNEMKQKKKNLNENDTNIDYVLIDGHKIINLKEKFVGTPEYIAPEVLEYKYDLIGPGVDIWAFGVMLYLFFAGVTPFKGKNDDETLENIKKVNYSWNIVKKHEIIEINIPKEAKDLIQKILIKDPTQRIGYNSKDYAEIKSHPFFKGINFDNLSEEPIPLNKAFSLLESFGYIGNNDIAVEKDDDIYINVLNKSDDKIMDEQHSTGSMDNAELRLNKKKLSFDKFQSLKMSFHQTAGNKLNKNENMIIENNDEKNNNLINLVSKHSKTIDNDTILIEDILYKKSPFVYYTKRYCKLFSKGHLDYYHFPTKVLKGSIIINENTKVNPIDDYRFELISQNKIYHFKHISKRITDDWSKNINKIILQKIRLSKK